MKLPHSYDIIGDILIFEVKDKISKKEERQIAEELLKLHKNVKVVAKVSKHHKGKYRLRKIEILVGEKRKETTHLENKSRLKLDIEKCYFSPRTGSERLKIAKDVKEGEDILVMFSGVAPFPIVISKNSKANKIYGIEINPTAHKYALENLTLNKIKNVELFKGDVKKILPELINKRIPLIGLKSHWKKSQLNSRLKYKPKLMEIHLINGDLENHLKELEKTIIFLKKKGIEIILHQPMKYKGIIIDPHLKEASDKTKECFKVLYKLCEKHKLGGFVIHSIYWGNNRLNLTNFKNLFREIKKSCKQFNKYAFLENSINKGGIQDLQLLKNLAELDKVCIDVTHAYIDLKNNDKILEYIKNIKSKVKYFHIGDSRGRVINEHTLVIGRGKIDFDRFKNYIKFGVIEVNSKDENLGLEEIESYNNYLKLIKDIEKFDKILMPLPKTAKDFLEFTDKYLKKKGIIYYYTFCGDKELNNQEKEILDLMTNYKILNIRKSGQYAPGVNKYCFELKKN